MQINTGGGFILSSVDERDYPICMAYEDGGGVVVPETFRTSFQPPCEKQLCGNCVAQTIANVLEVFYHNAVGVHEDFSVGFVYGNRDDGEYSGEGMTGYLACGHLVRDGDVKSAVFDNPGSAPSIIGAVTRFKEQNPSWREKAYVPSLYVRTESVGEVKKFIMKYDAPAMAVCKISDFSHGKGYHAMALYGWDGDVAIMQNSWGERSNLRTVELEFDKIIEFWLIMPYVIGGFRDTDVCDPMYGYIAKAVERRLLLGYPDGTFRGEAKLTRAEFSAIVYRYIKSKGAI